MKYTLTITQTIDTPLTPVENANGRIIGFVLPETLGSGQIKPNVCFEVTDNVKIADGTDVSKSEDLMALAIDDLGLEDFTREFEPISVEDSCGNVLNVGDTVKYLQGSDTFVGVFLGTKLGSNDEMAIVDFGGGTTGELKVALLTKVMDRN